MHKTHDLARKHGSGVLLTDGTNTWTVSDWSNNPPAVYGYRDGGRLREYEKLPSNGLRLQEKDDG